MSKFITRYFYSPLEKTTSVNMDDYAKRLNDLYEEFDKHGYDVINVVPMNMGSSESCKNMGGAYVTEACLSITRGAMVVGKKRG